MSEESPDGEGLPGRVDPRSGRLRAGLVYGTMIASGIAILLWIHSLGASLVAPLPPAAARLGEGDRPAHVETLLHVLLALVVAILASRALGGVFQRFHQPPVLGEIVAGILLGPSVLGRLAPSAAAYLFPQAVAPSLGILAQIGVILFMFLVGLHLDTALLRSRARATVAISHASIVVPFVLGAATALWLYPRLATRDVSFGMLAMFMGIAMSVTAFPVLARILTDRGMQKSRLGVIAIGCAAVDDVTAWCLLAMVVGVAQSRLGGAVLTVGLTLAYVSFMLAVVRPWIRRAVGRQERQGEVTRNGTAWVLVGLVASALATEYVGIHALFGAFILGALIPHDSLLARELNGKLEDVVLVLLLPAFFVFTGMRLEIGLLSRLQDWVMCLVIVLVACLGKFGGSAVAARLSGLDWRDSAILGVLLNTRGLMELIVLNIGLDLMVITPTLFAMMVIMTLVTTLGAAPVLHLLTRDRDRVGAAAVEVPGISSRST